MMKMGIHSRRDRSILRRVLGRVYRYRTKTYGVLIVGRVWLEWRARV